MHNDDETKMDPESVLQLVNREDIGEIAAQVREKLQRVKAAVEKG